MSDRVLWFPDDVAVGFLEASIGEAVVARGPARGRVRVPAGAAVHLWVRCPVRGLGLLHADDVDSVRITPAAPQSLKNGSDVAGSWEMRYLSDAGGMGATMDLHRDGSKVAGTWSGPLGEGRPISGTWRDGYIELSFAGEWPKESRQGAPGPVNAFLTGWIDGDSGKGRMRVEGRSDGAWMAKRKVSAASP